MSRLPRAGRALECKQVSGSIIITAKGTNEVVDIDRVAMLEGDPEMRSCEVNDGDATACKGSPRFMQAKIYCKGDQYNENERRDVPEVHSVPLEGELVWEQQCKGLERCRECVDRINLAWGPKGVYGQVG